MGFFDKLKQKVNIFSKIKNFFNKKVLNENYIEELEELLIQSDLSYKFTHEIINQLQQKLRGNNFESDEIYENLKEILKGYLKEGKINYFKKSVLLVTGINGVGKTTTIGKISRLLKNEGKKVIIGAADTFRAAASNQLEIWAKRASVKLIKGKDESDPASVVYDTLKEENYDVAIIDTAGRLHNKEHLMRELGKIDKIIEKHQIENYIKLLVLDSTLGQNSLQQAKTFNEVVDIDGFILTKLDSTSKGGVIFEISKELGKPLYFIGLGEEIEDIEIFNVSKFVENMF